MPAGEADGPCYLRFRTTVKGGGARSEVHLAAIGFVFLILGEEWGAASRSSST